MTFFLDNTNPPAFAPSLRAFGHDVQHLLEIAAFPNKGATKDEEWIPYVGGQGWMTITSDRRIATAQRQREIMQAARLTTFFLPKTYTQLQLWPQYQILVRAWEQIVANAERCRPGDCFDVQENGKVHILQLKR